MERYTREDIRSLRQAAEVSQKQKGSVFVTVLIILIFMGCGVFYIKTSHPEIIDSAVNYIKNLDFSKKTLETVSDMLYEGATENQSGESGEILKSAENLSFNYLPNGFEAVSLKSESAPPVLNATVTSNFGARTDPVTNKKNASHGGIDLAASEGSLIYAYKSGVVKQAGYNDIYGNCLLLSHDNGLETFYGHLSVLYVSEGDTVCTGDTLGVIGSTGKSTGVHLHFETRLNGQKVNPLPYYEKI